MGWYLLDTRKGIRQRAPKPQTLCSEFAAPTAIQTRRPKGWNMRASYIRTYDGATMVEIAPGWFVNEVVAKQLGLIG